MKFLVLTANSKEYEPLANLTDKTKEIYAMQHGYTFSSFNHDDTKRIAWERVEIWREALEECDWLFFTGCDAAITNPLISLRTFIDDDSDFIFAVDCNGLQSDSWLMRNCPATKTFLANVSKWEGKIQNEQHAMQLELSREPILSNYLASLPKQTASYGLGANIELIDCLTAGLNKSPVRCKIVEQKRLNSYPHEAYGFDTGSAYWLKDWCWQPGDFVCHLPGKSLEYRMDFFKELIKK